MAITFTKTSDGVLYQKTGQDTIAAYIIPFGAMSSFVIKRGVRTKMMIRFDQTKSAALPAYLEFFFSEVTSPLMGDEAGLQTALESYDDGYVLPEKFTAMAAQTDFIVVNPLTDKSLVIVDGLLVQKSEYTYDATTQTITFGAAFIGGEIINVISF